MRLDFHVHCNSEDPAQIKFLADQCVKMETIACLIGGKRYGECEMIPNERVLQICKEHSDVFLPIAKYELWDQVDPSLVYKYAEQGFRGLKFIYPYYEYDHDLYMDVYEAAEKCGLPMLFHTGNYRPSEQDAIWRRPMVKNMNVVNLDRIARSFPKANIVMAHLGTVMWRSQAVALLNLHPNLYSDLAGNGCWQGITADKLADLFRPVTGNVSNILKPYRKLVLGSDAYVKHPEIMVLAQEHMMMTFHKLGLPQEVIDQIMGGTVKRFMNIK